MFAKVVLLSALVSSAFATVFITNPTSSSTFNGGQNNSINWEDDGTSPSTAEWGNASVAIYTGNENEQTMLQLIAASVNVSATTSIQFQVDPSIGSNGLFYFIRMQSLTLVDNSTSFHFNELAFSHLFTMADMTGTFNASVSAEIAGQSTAPIGGSSTGSSASTATSASTTGKVAAASTTSSSTTSATTAAASNGAMGSSASVWGSALFGIVALALMC
ncbi:hypothetical protein BT96DRAFT_220279 [Gymnopus androsaceus JB14]|uniref:Yeast cell wall synthesis Kre9/Knh1-like N-terminal domain-containing protein n=1 Tax=Gymnopus androsaceus JB14 TaxID=1447944 RepID=A0A6A4IBP5_9AGAR|nr:hypothetical protein BT96DRAFT_220279 [Gymnopus androsaceus JB14]